MDNPLNSIVTNIIQVSPTMKILRVDPDGWELPEFKPGQFVALSLPASASRCPEATDEHETLDPDKMIKRAYSIASSSKDKGYLEFYITIVHSGSLTPRIFNLKIGDRIGMGNRIAGMFTLQQVPEHFNVVLIATGTGVAPYMSMLRSDALKVNRKICVIHGAANSWDLGYSSELRLLESLSDKFSYIPTITEPDKEPVESDEESVESDEEPVECDGPSVAESEEKEPVKDNFLTNDIELTEFRAFKRVCYTCCDPSDCTEKDFKTRWKR